MPSRHSKRSGGFADGPAAGRECGYDCQSRDHQWARRTFLGGVAGGFGAAVLGLSGSRRAVADELKQKSKQMLVIYLHGGVSQLETWDPKPLTDTGGPFRAIPTSVPGIHICELLPFTATQMHHLSLVRGLNTKEDDHGKGSYIMHTGRRQDPASEYPHLGSVAARYLAPSDSPLPGYVLVTPGGGGTFSQSEAAFLGPKYGAVTLGGGNPPTHSVRPDSLTEAADLARNDVRSRSSQRFAGRRRTADAEAYFSSFEQARQLMDKRDVFDVSLEPQADHDRYGSHDFGKCCLLARRLVEKGVTFVKVSHTNYDTHYENFEYHIEQLGEFDKTFATLIEDLALRGLLESTLVIVMSEFGRTPNINPYYGRDHWSAAWSVALAGCGIQHGAVVGKTNDNGTAVTDREVHGGHLFHTYLRAVGLDPTDQYDVAGRPIQMADPTASAIEELLA